MEIKLNADELRPVIERVLCEKIAELYEKIRADDARLAYSEEEAAEMLGVKASTLLGTLAESKQAYVAARFATPSRSCSTTSTAAAGNRSDRFDNER